MSDYTVYIDEAGDLGINRGTRWFVISGVIVAKDCEEHIRQKLSAIKTRLNVQQVHLRRVADYFKRALIVRELCDEQFTYINILVDTTKFDLTKIPTTSVAYNYVCKYLLQRVSSFLESEGATADVVLSSRGTSKDRELLEYICEKLLPYPGNNNINGNLFKKISAKSAGSWDLLQLADVCATTMFLAYEVNRYGFTTPCFSTALSPHLYRRHGKITNYGIKFFVHEMKPDITELRSKRVCIIKERTPGTTTT